jgi:AbiV family abortive infection protein
MQFKDIDRETLLIAAQKSYQNSIDFCHEAELIYKLRNYGHSISLAILGIEEIGKAIGYRLLYRFKTIPIKGRINFEPDDLLKDLQSKHFTKQSIAIIFSVIYSFASKDLSKLRKSLDKQNKTIIYDKKTKKFEINLKEIRKEISTIRKWNNELKLLPDFDITKQKGFYVEIFDSKKINFPKGTKSTDAKRAIKILNKIIKEFKNRLIYLI